MNDSYSILIIEDEKNILDFMSRTLKANGYKTTTVTSGKAGLSIINSQCPDLILLDLGLPDMDGNDIIASVREWTSCPIIVISAKPENMIRWPLWILVPMTISPSHSELRNCLPESVLLYVTATVWHQTRLFISVLTNVRDLYLISKKEC